MTFAYARDRRRLSPERHRLRTFALHADERPHADLQHDGRAQFRARQRFHDRRLSVVSVRAMDWVLACARHCAARMWFDRGGDRALWPAPCAQERTRRRDPLHVWPRVSDRGSGADDMGPQCSGAPRAGALIASMLIGILQTFAVAIDYSLLDLLRTLGVVVTRSAPLYDFYAIKVATAAPIVPYLLLVLMLIVRPRGLMGKRDV